MRARPLLLTASMALAFAVFAAIVRGSIGSIVCLDPAPSHSLLRVTPMTLAFVSVTALSLLVACAWVIGRQLFPRGIAPRRRSALLLVALFLEVVFAKLFLMRDNPVTAPFWDQWDAEARLLYIPFSHCDLTWPQMFSLHNEHRIFFTRLLALDLLVINGQWDPLVQQVVNAGIHAFTAAIIAGIFWLSNERRRLDVWVFVCGVIFAMPFAWENTLVGFQSAFYFLLIFSVAALWLVTESAIGSIPWCLGWACAGSALFTSAGGVTSTVAIGSVILLKVAGEQKVWREALINLAVAAGVTGAGWALASPPLPGHEELKARTAAEFSGALWHNLAWPWIFESKMALVMWMPACVLLFSVAWRRGRTTILERLSLGLGAWVLLNSAAIAFGRGAAGAYPARRYMDFLSLGLVANAGAVIAMLNRAVGTTARRVMLAALAGWLAFAVIGVDRLTTLALADLGVWRQFYANHAANVRRYVVTGDLHDFMSKPPLNEIPYPDPQSLAITLRDPYIRSILSRAVREPVHLEPLTITNEAFVPDGSPVNIRDPLWHTWGSYSARGRAAEGRAESQVATATCRWGTFLAIPVSGYLGNGRHSLGVKDAVTRHEFAIAPRRIPKEGWVEAIVACRARPFVIVATDADSESWFAFREPVVVGWASLLVARAIAWSRELLFAALACLLLLWRTES
jgi:hypothetical protein